jgi:micrococcal nuclease
MLSVLVAAALVIMAPGRLADPDGGTPRLEKVRVVSVHDGDTITISLDGRSEKVRLVGIDTPELRDERAEYRREAEAARDFARSALKGKTVTLEADRRQGDRDGYARLLRYVILGDGTNSTRVGPERVREVYDRFAFTLKRDLLAEAEASNGSASGIWPWKSPAVGAPALIDCGTWRQAR